MVKKAMETRVIDDSPGVTSAPEEPTLPENDGSTTLVLTTEIPVYNERTRTIERMKKITFRKPTALDIIELGNPVAYDPISEPPKIDHKPTIMIQMMTRLSGVPLASLAKMEPRDLVSCFWALTPFFMPRPDI